MKSQYRVVQASWGWVVETKLSYARSSSNGWVGITRFATELEANNYLREVSNV